MNSDRPKEEAVASRLLDIVEAAQTIDVRSFEQRPAATAHEGLLPRILAVIDEAIGLCRETLEAYDEDTGQTLPSWLDETPARDSGVFLASVDALVETQSASKQVADLAFMGATALTPKRGVLGQLGPNHDVWEIVSECGSARRRIIKTLTALEMVLAESEGREPRLAFASELGRSLETRRRYTQLRRSVIREEFAAARAVPILRGIGTAIAMLVGRDIYPDLRIPDRRQLRDLQARILDWLRQESEGANGAQAAQRLHQDLVMFAGLLGQVRRRQELVEHDIVVLRQLLDTSAFVGLDSGAVQETLESLEGLNDELDALLSGPSVNRELWLPVVCRVFDGIRGAVDNPCDGPCGSVEGAA